MSASERAAAVLTIDLDAIVENWLQLSARVAPTACAAVVKADGYGLGARPVASALYAAGCRQFFVAMLDEGIALRTVLPADAAIHVLHGPLPGTEAECVAHDLIPVLNTPDQIERYQGLARLHGRRLPAALQIDTGMARLGLQAREVQRLAAQPHAMAGIDLRLVMSHLVSAEEPANPLNLEQRHRFDALRVQLPACPASLVNSSGIFLGRDFHYDLARPGAALYGIAPVGGQANPMHGVLRLQARLIQLRDIEAGEHVGYNHTWQADRATRVATLSVGYADGYLRSLSNRATLRVQGHDVRLIGRVSMDTITVDVSDLPARLLQPGALFDLLDADHDINALAVEANTNAYELLTHLGARYARRYVGHNTLTEPA